VDNSVPAQDPLHSARIEHVVAKVRLHYGAPTDGDVVLLDATFAVRITTRDGTRRLWNGGAWLEEIDVKLPGAPCRRQLELLARSATDDLIRDMRLDGFDDAVDSERIPIKWHFERDVEVLWRQRGGEL
jgi:hypothetical protein